MVSYLDYFMPEIDSILTKLKNAEGGFLIGEKTEDKLRQSLVERLTFVTGDYMQKQMAELIKDENPFAALDPRMITEQERIKMRPVLLEKLEKGEIILPESMQKLIKTIMQNCEDFFITLFRNLSLHRKEICECIFDGRTYSVITDYSEAGDPHNHGKCTVILETDAGRMIYKPHNCKVDAAAYIFMNRYFEDIICVPKAYAVSDEFGISEFLEKRVCEGDEEAKQYYYSLGGVAAVIKALGSRDMHNENLFAVGNRLALIDLETLLYPEKEKIDYPGSVIYESNDVRKIKNSLFGSSLLNVRYEDEKNDIEREYSILFNTDEEGSAPVVSGRRPSVLGYKDEFTDGFISLYHRCMEQRDNLKKDIETLFSDAVFRIIIGGTQGYYEITSRLNSSYRYESEDYYASQLQKLPEVLGKMREKLPEAVKDYEIKALLENNIPFFYTYGNSTSLWCEGEETVKDFAIETPVKRALKLIDSMNEKDMDFEISFMHRFMSISKKKTENVPAKAEGKKYLTPEEAYTEAMCIMNQIYDSAIWFENGEPVWLGFMPGSPTAAFMNQGLYSGVAGLAVFFAAVYVTAEDGQLKEKARICLESIMKRLERYISSELFSEKQFDEYKYNVGEGDGIAGILRTLIIVNHILEGTYSNLVIKGKNLAMEINPHKLTKTDKAQGISGLISTLCRYEEFYTDEKIRELVKRLADRLSELRSLKYRGEVLWNTLDEPYPISGAVHGMMGIAEAYLRADLLLGTDKYASDAEVALSFEERSYNEKLMNWTDLRVPGNNRPSGGNCYGAEGMGIILYRLKQAGINNDIIDGLSKRAAAVVDNREYYSLDHLCCGEMSVVEYYLETGDTLSAEKRLTTLLESRKVNGVYRLGFTGYVPNNNVTMFYGLAGIGYELLRYAYPGEFPSVV